MLPKSGGVEPWGLLGHIHLEGTCHAGEGGYVLVVHGSQEISLPFKTKATFVSYI